MEVSLSLLLRGFAEGAGYRDCRCIVCNNRLIEVGTQADSAGIPSGLVVLVLAYLLPLD